MKNPIIKRKTVASVMSKFTKARDELLEVQAAEFARIDALEAKIAKLNEEADAASEEAMNASAAIQNLERFFVPTKGD